MHIFGVVRLRIRQLSNGQGAQMYSATVNREKRITLTYA